MIKLDACLDAVMPHLNTEKIIQDIGELNEIEKPSDFDSFARAGEYLHGRFEEAGLESAILHFPADGKAKFGTYTAPIGFRTRKASVEILSPERKLLGARPEEPNTAVIGSGHTPPEGLIAPVVHIGAKKELDAKDVRGCFVFADKINPQQLRNRAIACGAVGIVSSFMDMRDSQKFVKWINTWDCQDDGWLPTQKAAEENFSGVSISSEMGEYVLACLKQGPMQLRVNVEGEYFAGELPGVWAGRNGESPDAALLTGHLFEPGWMDNASGVMVSYWAGVVLAKIQQAGGGRPFKRTWRHFHSQECYGVLALKTLHPELIRPLFAHLNLDGVGVHRSPLSLRPGLLATDGFSHLLLKQLLAKAAARAGCEYKFLSDFEANCTLLAEPAAGGVPTSLMEQKDYWWHTSEDRRGTLPPNPRTLAAAAASTAAWLYFLVSAGTEEAEQLLAEYRGEITEQLRANTLLDTEVYLAAKRREVETLQKIVVPKDREMFAGKIAKLFAALQDCQYRKTILGFEKEKEWHAAAKRLYPKTIVFGPAVNSYFSAEQLAIIGWPKWDSLQLSLKAWADGSRSAFDIARLIAVEIGKEVPLAYVVKFFEIYAQAGLVQNTSMPIT